MSYRTRKWGAVHDTTSESNLICIFQLVSHRDATRYHRQLDPQLLQLTVNIKVSRITLHCSAEGKYNFLNAAAGHPLLGDWLYGQEDRDLIPRPALHSHRLELTHPVTRRRLTVTAPLPEDMARLLPEDMNKS